MVEATLKNGVDILSMEILEIMKLQTFAKKYFSVKFGTSTIPCKLALIGYENKSAIMSIVCRHGPYGF